VSVPQSSGDVDEVTAYRSVIVSYNERSVLEPTLGEAVARLFPGFEGDIGDRVEQAADPEPGDPDLETPVDEGAVEAPTDTTVDTGTTDAESSTDGTLPLPDDAAALLERADDLFVQADQALADGDLGEYQNLVDEARDLVGQAVSILQAGG
jgi:uncharacterized protein